MINLPPISDPAYRPTKKVKNIRRDKGDEGNMAINFMYGFFMGLYILRESIKDTLRKPEIKKPSLTQILRQNRIRASQIRNQREGLGENDPILESLKPYTGNMLQIPKIKYNILLFPTKTITREKYS